MKAWIVVAGLLVVGVSGCLDADEETDSGARSTLELASVNAPEGATLIEEGGKIVAQWLDAVLPFQASFELPEGATMVRFVADPGAGSTIGVSMSHDDTGRRRCNQQTVAGFGQSYVGARSCSSIAAIDPPGTNWTARASGTGTANVQVEFLGTPIDGPAGQVDWSQLSHATYDLHPTQGFYITAHDGARLWVEVTLPIGDGPWPTVVAASPYNLQTGRIPDSNEGSTNSGTPAMWTYWTQDYAKRGYAAVNIDVRGFGKSGGCVEVWGENEQLDQKLIVDWVAEQGWSDGKVGFYGQSYVATTPVAAAVQAPEALKAIIAVAPVIDAYHDWHFGGVPNGESSLSPVAYQALVDIAGTGYLQEQAEEGSPTPTDIQNLLQYSTQGICDPTLIPLANDPRAIHGDFYDVRDFGARAGDITAAVLFTEGFEDANVKSAMIPDWFNDIEAPKLGVFGHWLHQHPARMDAEALFLGWMDEHVKGKNLGIMDAYPNALISMNDDHHRGADAWPALEYDRTMHIDFAEGTLDAQTGAGDVRIDMTPASAANAPGAVYVDVGNYEAVLETSPLTESLVLSGPRLHLVGYQDAQNAFVHATLEAVRSDGTTQLLTYGMRNLQLENGYDTYVERMPLEAFDVELPFRETELLVEAGSSLRLTIRGVQVGEAVGTAQPQPGFIHLESDTRIELPAISLAEFEPMPISALP